MLQWSNKEFASNFRLNHDAFDALLELLWTGEERLKGNEELSKLNQVGPKRKTLMCLWYLANQNSFREIADKFNVTKSKAHASILQVLCKICSLSSQFIQWPSHQEMDRNANFFGRRAQCPRAIGAIDGCHIRIQKPKHSSAASYMNRKGYYSILLQGICDSVGKFLDVFIGMPGSVHDARMLRVSDVYQRWEDLLQGHTLLGDSAYIGRMFRDFIESPVRDNGRLTEEERLSNTALSSGRVIIENAFGRLKCQFRRLRDLQNTRLDVCVMIILAACTLYNFMIIKKADFACEDHPNGECPREDDDNDDDD
jgi:hypothetical protein